MKRKQLKAFRRGNIEFRSTKDLRDNPYYEIVKWCPNPFFGKESEFIKDEFGRLVHKSKSYFISESILKHEEYCYTITIFDEDDDYVTVKEVENNEDGTEYRKDVLNEEDGKNYEKVLAYAMKRFTNRNLGIKNGQLE